MPTYEQRWGHPRTRRAYGNRDRDRRRREAEERQNFWDSLTIEQKIARVKARVGNSSKELARLRAMLG